MSKPRRPKRPVDGILLLDKPQGITSNAAMMQVRHLYAADKAGHTGSLDPMATGMLPICFGNATKLSGQLLASDKTYRATISLGSRTDSGDADGAVIETAPVPAHDEAQLQSLLAAAIGPQQQVPPMVSALKQDGKRLYALAREGIEVERAPREIVIHDLQLVAWTHSEWVIDVHCSKGTYIRVLAEDLARQLGALAHLSGLRRHWVAPFSGPLWTLEALEDIAKACGHQALDACLLPLNAALPDWPMVAVTDDQAGQLRAGQPIVGVEGAGQQSGEVAVVNRQGQVQCLAVWRNEGRLWPKRWLARDESSPR